MPSLPNNSEVLCFQTMPKMHADDLRKWCTMLGLAPTGSTVQMSVAIQSHYGFLDAAQANQDIVQGTAKAKAKAKAKQYDRQMIGLQQRMQELSLQKAEAIVSSEGDQKFTRIGKEKIS